MIQGTPVMSSAGPARNMAATPQPRMNQGSPVGMQGGTPIMMQTPQTQAGHSSMTPEQMQQLQATQQMQQRMRLMQQQGMQASGQNMSQQQMALLKASAHIQQHGIPQGQNPQQYKSMLAQRFYQSLMQQQQNAQMNMNAQGSGAIPGQPAVVPMGQPGMGANMPNMGMQQSLQQNLQNLRTQYNTQKQQFLNTFRSPQAFPAPVQQRMQQMEITIRQKENELRQLMQANMGMGGQPAQLQYQQQLQQQRAQHARQQQLLAMQQQRQGMNSNQMPQNMMGNMAMMNSMNMNAQNGGGMQNPAGMNVQNMAAMNGGQMGQLNPQQQMQFMLMRQQQQQMMNHQQRTQGDGSGIEWGG
jgi:transcription factor SPT20